MRAARNTFCASLLAVSCVAALAQGASVPASGYWEAKAQCWADLAGSEAAQGDTRGTPATAQGNAQRIRAALAADVAPTADDERPIYTRELLPADDPRDGRPVWRQDIQAIDATIGRYRERQCRTAVSACLEVAQASVYENMEETQGARWNHGRPEIDHALSLASKADAAFQAECPEQKTLQGVDVLATAPLEVVDLPTDALFRFDQGDAKGILPDGRQAIADLALKLRGYGSRVAKLEVVGYTDRLGSPAYNVALSQRRASTVAASLKTAGIAIPIEARGAGPAEPVTGHTCKAVRLRAALIACLQPDRRVAVRILPARK